LEKLSPAEHVYAVSIVRARERHYARRVSRALLEVSLRRQSRYFRLYAMTKLPVFALAQRWLAYRADSELAGQYVSLSLTLHERTVRRVGGVQLLVDNR